MRQAREACYALREFIEKDDRWTQGRLRWDHVIVLPNAEIADEFALPECPRWKVIDRNDLPTLVGKLKQILVQQELDRPLLTPPTARPSLHAWQTFEPFTQYGARAEVD